jgi:hypothetical protein
MKMGDPPVSAAPIDGRYDLSVMLGGPLYQLYRRTHVSGAGLELLHRRVIVLTLLAWLPLLPLSLVDGFAWSGVKVPFLLDVSTHARLLIALPLLVFAELVVHQRMPGVVRQFVDRGIVGDSARPQFEAAIASAMRLRNSIIAEILLLLFVYAIGIGVIWRQDIALPVSTWYRQLDGAVPHVTRAGLWNGLVSVPVFQFLLFRWYFRLGVWAWFLWQVSRIELTLSPLHPDRNAGLGFLSGMPRAFAPLVLAHGTLLAGMFADAIFFTGASLAQYKIELIAVLAIVLLLVVGPLLVFMPVLARAKRTGTREYGMFAQHYVDDFKRKWLHGQAPAGEPALGSADIQSLADLGNSYEVVKEIRLIPVSRSTLLYLVVMTLIPIAPLLLTMISFDELLERLVKLVF